MTASTRPASTPVRKLRRVVIREELVALTGHWRLAVTLNQFLYWSERHRDFDRFLAEERTRNPDHPQPLTYGWIYKSAKELLEELMLDVSEVTLRRDIGRLVAQGYLAERHNPTQKWDRELQYRPDVWAIQRALQQLGYTLEGYPLLADAEGTVMEDAFFTVKNASSTVKNRANMVQNRSVPHEGSNHHDEGAVPETPTKTTTETTGDLTSDECNSAVVALMELGLGKRQAWVAVNQHRLTLSEVAQWQAWLETIDGSKTRPLAVFAAAIREQRLPPGLRSPAPQTLCSRSTSGLASAPAPATILVPRVAAAPYLIPIDDAWHGMLQSLKPQVDPSAWETWLKPTMLLGLDEDKAIISTPNIFVRQEVEAHYVELLAAALQNTLGRPVCINLVIANPAIRGSI